MELPETVKRKAARYGKPETGIYTTSEVAVMQDCSIRTAQKLVKRMNDELEEKGYIRCPKGVPKKYYHERTFC